MVRPPTGLLMEHPVLGPWVLLRAGSGIWTALAWCVGTLVVAYGFGPAVVSPLSERQPVPMRGGFWHPERHKILPEFE
jgi:hypothetical protein